MKPKQLSDGEKNVKGEAVKELEENIDKCFHSLGVEKPF